jgi:hypothetical protein
MLQLRMQDKEHHIIHIDGLLAAWCDRAGGTA